MVVVLGGMAVKSGRTGVNFPQLLLSARTAFTSGSPGEIGSRISQTLDSLISPQQAAPVILGVKITSDSLNTLVDVVHKLPPEQVEQIKAALCAPATSEGKKAAQ